MGIGKLQDDLKNYLACHKINSEYSSQLNNEQKADIRRRIDDANKQADISLVSAYSIVAKYSVKNGIEAIVAKQFKDSLDSQININIIGALKEEEWLLESIGLSTFKKHNLLPTPEQSLKAKDIFEAFIRYDDKPMITGSEAVSKSIQKYCTNGEYSIATGDGTAFTRYFFKESVPFFDVSDITYWLVDKSLIPAPKEIAAPVTNANGEVVIPASTVNEPTPSTETGKKEEAGTPKQFKAITVSGKVPLERYVELFNYFITPFAMNGNRIEIEMKFKIHSTPKNTLDESKQQYKSAKEAAKQLGLNFEEDV